MIMASMRNWLHGGELHADSVDGEAKPAKRRFSFKSEEKLKAERKEKRVVVVHCKAGKGRSGTVSCSYLISEEGWTPEDALARFTARRMRPRFGAGVSIPSQLRTVSYVDRWTKGGKKYYDRPIEILEIHVWGLRDGVKVDIAGFADEGKRIEVLHTFRREERHVIEGDAPDGGGLGEMMWQMAGYSANPKREAPEEAPLAESANLEEKDPRKSHSLKKRGTKLIHKASSSSSLRGKSKDKDPADNSGSDEKEPGGKAVILRPTEPVRIANSDVQVSVERRNKTSKSMGFTMVSAVAHVWFNTFFEGNGPEQNGKADDNGVFTIEWDAMDGIKGSSRKGARALDRMSVVWRAAGENCGGEVDEPKEGEPVPQLKAADWKGGQEYEKELGLRTQSPESADVSKASSLIDDPKAGGAGGSSGAAADDIDEWQGMRTSGPTGEELVAGGGKEEKKR
jgi:hypothetical protein